MIISCNKKDCDYNEKIRKIETDKIVEALVLQKHLENFKDSYAICSSFKKIKINTESVYTNPSKKLDVVKLPPRLPIIIENTEIYIEKLLNANLKGKKIFQISDSINFVEQNSCFLKYSLPQDISKKLKTISVFKIQKASNYIILSIPIFSEDNQKAYMEVDCYPEKDQYGFSVYLEKKDNFWKIKDVKGNWNRCSD